MSIFRILHGAGNIRDLLPLASHPAVDAIEADIWVRGESLVAHHDRPLGPLPFTIGKHGVHHEDKNPVDLEDIFGAIGAPDPHAHLLLNLRSWLADPAPDLARKLLATSYLDHLAVSCEASPVADRLRAWIPELLVTYSVRYEQQFRRYMLEANLEDLPPRPVSIRHTLLHSAEEVRSLKERAGSVDAWTVDDVDRALELAEWGVTGIVSNNVTVLNAL